MDLTARTLVASAARTATGNSGSIAAQGGNENVSVLLACSAVSGTSPSLTLTVEWSHDGTNWAQGDSADTFTAITATGNKVKSFTVKGAFMRLVWTVSGTTPSFTFGVTGVGF